MNKWILIIVFAILGILGVIFYSSQQPRAQQDKIMQGDHVMDDDEDHAMMSNQRRYVEYSKKALDNAVDRRKVLFFYANWCSTCRPTDVNFKENISKIPEDVVVIRVNYNDPDTDQEEKDLAQKYGIVYQHTFVQIDSKGDKITAWNGGAIDELLNNLK